MQLELSYPLLGAIVGVITGSCAVLAISCLFRSPILSPFIERQLQDLVQTFQNDIPMASMFLKGKMVDSLKNKAHHKIMENIPKVKKKIIVKLSVVILTAGTGIGILLGIIFSLAFGNV